MIQPISQYDDIPLEAYQPRAFVPDNADLRHPPTVTALYDRLIGEEVTSVSELEAWLAKRSELEAALDQQETILYIRMTCQTDNPEKARAYQDFVRNIEPIMHRKEHELNRKFLNLQRKFPLDPGQYGVLIKAIESDLELFRQENVELFTKISLLSQEYQRIWGGITVEFKGREHTLPQMAKYALQPDRSVREEAWRTSTERCLREKETMEALFDKMLVLRHTVAVNAGFDGYEAYAFKAKHRFDYTSEHCRQYHHSVERHIVPLWRRILEDRRKRLGIERLRPWDLSVDLRGRPPLKPFERVEELIRGVQAMFDKTDPRLGKQFAQMSRLGLLDLESRKGKAPGGYQSTLSEFRKPFIFMNAVGIDSDVRTLLHEGGHAFHAMACAHQPLYDYRHGPMEFNEVASMAMEMIADDHISEFYSDEEAQRSRRNHIEDIIFVLCWVATIDAFQQWIYAHPEQDYARRKDYWLEVHNRFSGGVVDWSGLEDARAHAWHRQLHIFEAPFYYIEYGIAQLGALQLWLRARRDKKKALDRYLNALALGGSRPLPELFSVAGLTFDFSEKTIQPLAASLEQEWRAVAEAG